MYIYIYLIQSLHSDFILWTQLTFQLNGHSERRVPVITGVNKVS